MLSRFMFSTGTLFVSQLLTLLPSLSPIAPSRALHEVGTSFLIGPFPRFVRKVSLESRIFSLGRSWRALSRGLLDRFSLPFFYLSRSVSPGFCDSFIHPSWKVGTESDAYSPPLLSSKLDDLAPSPDF